MSASCGPESEGKNHGGFARPFSCMHVVCTSSEGLARWPHTWPFSDCMAFTLPLSLKSCVRQSEESAGSTTSRLEDKQLFIRFSAGITLNGEMTVGGKLIEQYIRAYQIHQHNCYKIQKTKIQLRHKKSPPYPAIPYRLAKSYKTNKKKGGHLTLAGRKSCKGPSRSHRRNCLFQHADLVL